MANELDDTVKNDTCFAAHSRACTNCERRECHYWIENKETLNCSLIAASAGEMTLEQVGKIFGLTRMRICQIEKNVYKKIMLHLSQHQL
jgi:hypothetical protein